jgi:hypothetical protein
MRRSRFMMRARTAIGILGLRLFLSKLARSWAYAVAVEPATWTVAVALKGRGAGGLADLGRVSAGPQLPEAAGCTTFVAGCFSFASVASVAGAFSLDSFTFTLSRSGF